jgi:HK97 family phage major capsid protein
MRALSAPTDKRAWDDAAFEREVSDAVAGKFKQRKFQGNIQIPTEVLVSGMRNANLHKRDLNVANGTQGGYLVANELQPASFIELLRNRLMVRMLGARVLTGLEGNLSIPKQTGGATAYWLTESGAPSESEQGIGQVGLTPKTVGAYTEFTRRMILQSSLDVENFVRDDLAKVLATAIDKAAIKGTGASGEPLGILNTTGIGSVTITTGTFTDAKMIDLETEVAIDNADLGALAYLASAADRGRMKKQDIGTDTGKRVWTTVPGQPGVGEVNGYFAYATNQLAADEVIFGNWEDLIIGEWGVLDMLVNPYAKDTSGGVRVTAFQDVDCAVRHPESFARTTV